MKYAALLACFVFATMGPNAPASAQTASSPTLSDLARDTAPDRVARLLPAARKEGALLLYTTIVMPRMNTIIQKIYAQAPRAYT